MQDPLDELTRKRKGRPGHAVRALLDAARRAGHPECVDAAQMERAERADARRSGKAYGGCYSPAGPNGELDVENESRLRAMLGEPPMPAPLTARVVQFPRALSLGHRVHRGRGGGRPGARRVASTSAGGGSSGDPDEPEPGEAARRASDEDVDRRAVAE